MKNFVFGSIIGAAISAAIIKRKEICEAVKAKYAEMKSAYEEKAEEVKEKVEETKSEVKD
jgi:hypothetical protein